jgi:SAM-dependent methyltransferase
MLADPASFAPYPYREDRLEVVDMDARQLEFPDESFDIVFSLSSIEHFGGPADVRRAAAEMARVVRPGGHLVIATECFLGSHFLDSPWTQFAVRLATLGRRCGNATPQRRSTECFTPRDIRRLIIEPTGMELVQPLDCAVSERTYENTIRWVNGEPIPESGEPYPHLVLQAQGAPWTSAVLAFDKP